MGVQGRKSVRKDSGRLEERNEKSEARQPCSSNKKGSYETRALEFRFPDVARDVGSTATTQRKRPVVL